VVDQRDSDRRPEILIAKERSRACDAEKRLLFVLGRFSTAKPGFRGNNPRVSDYNALEPVVVELWPPANRAQRATCCKRRSDGRKRKRPHGGVAPHGRRCCAGVTRGDQPWASSNWLSMGGYTGYRHDWKWRLVSSGGIVTLVDIIQWRSTLSDDLCEPGLQPIDQLRLEKLRGVEVKSEYSVEIS